MMGPLPMFRSVLLISLAALVAGCGQQGNVAPVSGVVTLNGKPVANVAVTFQPIASEENHYPGPAAFGVTGPDGRYTASLMAEETKGASVGKNQVRFSAHVTLTDFSDEAVRSAKPAVKIPARYWYDSKIEFDVPASGTDAADFQLTSP